MTHQIEDEGHPHPCWWLRRQYMAARSADLWWRLQQLRPSSMRQAKRALYSLRDAELGSALPQEVTSSQIQSPHCAASAASGVSRFFEISRRGAFKSRVGATSLQFAYPPLKEWFRASGERAIRGEGTDRSAAKSVIRSKVSDQKLGDWHLS